MACRMAVYYVFPMFMISVRAAKGVILFKRGRQHDKEVRHKAFPATHFPPAEVICK